MLESIDEWMVNETIMPTLTKLKNSGINFSNRYAPSYGNGKTINSEIAANLGIYQPNNGDAVYKYNKNSYPYSLPNLFKNSGYITNSIHFNKGSYYDRSMVHISLGYNKHYSLLDMGFNDVTDDRVLIKNDDIYKLIVPDIDKFMSFVITYSAHMPYSNSNMFCSKIKSVSVSNDCIKKVAFITDEFLNLLIKKLEDENKLDDTVLILFSDHYAYSYSDILKVKNSDNHNLDKVPLIIWSNSIKGFDVKNYTGTIDLVPIIANLFNLKTDYSKYLGIDTLSNANYVYFSDGTYIGNKNESISIFDKIKINDYILQSNYYK